MIFLKFETCKFSIHWIFCKIRPQDPELIHAKALLLRSSSTDFHISYRQFFCRSIYNIRSRNLWRVSTQIQTLWYFIGTDTSRLDPLLKQSKILQIHAVLHGAAGLIKDCRNTGPVYVYGFRFSSKNLYFWSSDRNTTYSNDENCSFKIILRIFLLENFEARLQKFLFITEKEGFNLESIVFIKKN